MSTETIPAFDRAAIERDFAPVLDFINQTKASWETFDWIKSICADLPEYLFEEADCGEYAPHVCMSIETYRTHTAADQSARSDQLRAIVQCIKKQFGENAIIQTCFDSEHPCYEITI